MHDLLVLLYCSASGLSRTPDSWVGLVETTLPHAHPVVYDEDPFVFVSLVHAALQPATLDTDRVVGFVSDSGRDIWGPAAWRFLHSTARTHPQGTMALLEWYTKMLPCEQCRLNLRRHMDDTPTVLDMHAYTVEIHNKVNESLGKPVVNLP